MRRAAVAIAIGACWREPRPAAPTPAATCAATVATMIDAIHSPHWDDETKGNLRAVIAYRCTEDRWSADALACFAAAKTEHDVDTCGKTKLAKDQLDRIERVGRAISDADRASKHGKPAEGVDPILRVTGVEPDRGDPSGGTYAKIYGNRFTCHGGCTRRVKVYFGSRQGTVVRIASDEELVVEAPGGTAGDTVDVLVMFEPGGELKLPRAFTFVAPSTPSTP